MKRIKMLVAVIAVIAAASTVTGCSEVVTILSNDNNKVVAEGPKVRQERKITAVDELEVSSGLSVKYIQSEENKVVVEAPESLIDVIATEVKGTTLKIYPKKSFRTTSGQSINIEVMAPMIVEFEASSGSSLAVSKGYVATGRQVEIDVSSGASASVASVDAAMIDIDCGSGASCGVAGIKAAKVEADASSGASLSLQGNAERVVLKASGGASLSAGGLSADRGTLTASGGASLHGNVRNPSISSSGGGSVRNN